MNVNLKQRFQEILEDNRILEAELMSRHTTFRIGGPADFFLVPENADEIRKIIAVCKEKNVPYFILGNGSNLLVSDKGYQGVVVQLYRNFGQIRVEDSRIHAQAGALLSGIAAAAREASLTGFEFAGGIPGTLGGAVVMNAGAYGGEMKDVLKEVTVLTPEGGVLTLQADELICLLCVLSPFQRTLYGSRILPETSPQVQASHQISPEQFFERQTSM